ncbi:hypothetical protein AOQ84DRAFT_89909 [Glonium stellatum]|uniref:Uncharacterized protein n=1 Tax=Glonium stellatum TaxID=574774 RepID=A0A8E2EVW4_9PEZI|nr:hypothetical protein AOQ84DRAFT_89909 [Glonium stellatum]
MAFPLLALALDLSIQETERLRVTRDGKVMNDPLSLPARIMSSDIFHYLVYQMFGWVEEGLIQTLVLRRTMCSKRFPRRLLARHKKRCDSSHSHLCLQLRVFRYAIAARLTLDAPSSFALR